MDLEEIGCEGADWMQLIQDWVQWLAQSSMFSRILFLCLG